MNDRQNRISQFERLTSAIADHVDGVIYHYTSAEGLRGIIENSEIWLSNVSFVNDTTECTALQEETDLFNDSKFTNSFVEGKWKNFIRSPDNIQNIYIASFSRGEESLEQYRAYGNYRIGFEAKKLISRGYYLYQCVYNKEEIKKWIIEKEKLNEWDGEYLNDQYKRGAADILIFVASKKYKNKHFEKEREVRLISVSNHSWGSYTNSSSMFEKEAPIHFRDHSAYKVPVPYVKFIIKNNEENIEEANETYKAMKERKLRDEKINKRDILPITDISIGPMTHQKEAEIACNILLSDKGYENIKVNVSNIPYRGY